MSVFCPFAVNQLVRTYAYRGELRRLVNIAMSSFLRWYQKTCNINLTRSLLAHLLLSVRKLTSSYTAVQALCWLQCTLSWSFLQPLRFSCCHVILTLSGPFRRSSSEQRDICILPSDAAVQTAKYGLVLLSVARCPHLTLKLCAVRTARCPDHFCSR